ncbi:hypothetical protein GCM10027614_56280 [Micromonospora vulcania]
MDAPHPKQLAAFVRATAVLALSPPQQVAWLESLEIQVSVDELALEFEDGHLLLPQWVEAGWLPPDAGSAFSAVDEALTGMSGADHAELWTVAALHEAPAWARVRELAARVLHLL